MTASLLVFVPVALLGLVAAFCFVGCAFHTHGTGQGFTTYSDNDVIGNKDCVAYWPLNDSPGQDTALDVVGKALGNPHNGTYQSAASSLAKVNGLFPCPDFDLGGGLHSDFAPGNLTISAPGIVQGDTVPPHDPNNPILANCMDVDGGFVTVDPNNVINLTTFTVEAWVLPKDAAVPPAIRIFIDSRGIVGGVISGFALLVNAAGRWEAAFSVAGPVPTVLVTGGPASLTVATHVVLTFDGNNAALFINGTQSSTLTSLPMGSTYTPNTTAALVIGVGLPWLPPRMNHVGNAFFPLAPFKGKIQDVAIYSVVLDPVTIMNHAQHGQGNATG